MKTNRAWIVAALLLAGCGPGEQAKQPPKPVPGLYRVRLETNKGNVVIEVHKDWAPEGAERFHRLVQQGFYDGARFFRVVRDFVVQFGIAGDPRVNARWRGLTIKDDPVRESNRHGFVTFATSGPNTRTTQVFINLNDNVRLDKLGFAPFGQVVEGMDVVDSFWKFYGDGPPKGSGPDQEQIERRGNAYLEEKFPRLDYILKARLQ